MTQPQDPRKHPLQDDEVALARVLRALPAGEPPASVDAAILRAATDAVSQPRRTPAQGVRWLPTWAIGTAAAAVLAVGIGLQLRPPLPPEAAPASVSEAVKPLPPSRERLSVDLVEPDQATAPPPASAPPSLNRATRPAPPPPPPPPPTAIQPEAFPAPMAEAPVADAADAGIAMEAAAAPEPADDAEPRIRSEANDQARRVHQEAYARRAQARASAESQSRQADAASASAADSQRASASAPPAPVLAPPPPPANAPTTGATAGFAATPGLPPVAEDARLAPEAWLERIRERRRQGDSAGARASLRLFVQAHPEAPIPRDLARLR